MLELRAATEDDAGAVSEVFLRSRHELVRHAPLAHPDDAVRAWIRNTLIPRGVTVAVADSKIVGMLVVSRNGDVGWMDHLYVSPDWLRRGVGKRLLEHALTILARPIRLFTFQASGPARTFYERAGFQAVAFGDGSANEERCPDVLYEWRPDAGAQRWLRLGRHAVGPTYDGISG